MTKIVKTLFINAPPEKVFDYVETPANLTEYWPGIREVSDVEELSAGRYKYRVKGKMAGMTFDTDVETTEFIPSQRTVTKSTTGGVSSTVVWECKPEGSGTQVTFDSDYTIPVPLLGKLAESVIVKINEIEANELLANVKAKMEL